MMHQELIDLPANRAGPIVDPAPFNGNWDCPQVNVGNHPIALLAPESYIGGSYDVTNRGKKGHHDRNPEF